MTRAMAMAEQDIADYKAMLDIPEDANVDERLELVVQLQSSFVLIDQKTGYVKALVGGRGEKTSSMSYNRATAAARQPGSTFKILSTYAPALDVFGDTLASTKVDKVYTGYGGHQVNNVDMYCSNAPTTFRSAIEQSKNTVATWVMDEDVTPEYAYNFLTERFGLYDPCTVGSGDIVGYRRYYKRCYQSGTDKCICGRLPMAVFIQNLYYIQKWSIMTAMLLLIMKFQKHIRQLKLRQLIC